MSTEPEHGTLERYEGTDVRPPCRCRTCRVANVVPGSAGAKPIPAQSEHEMQIRMLGNAWVYVTCKCLTSRRSGWRERTFRTQRINKNSPEWRSLGDFPVGADVRELRAAYDAHLEG